MATPVGNSPLAISRESSDRDSPVSRTTAAMGSICSFDTGYLQCSVDAAISGVGQTLWLIFRVCKPPFCSPATFVFIHHDGAPRHSLPRHTHRLDEEPIRASRRAVCQRKRSEESRVGKTCVGTSRSWWSADT